MAQSGTLKCESKDELSGGRKGGSGRGEGRGGGGEGLSNLFDARTHLTFTLVDTFL